MIDTDREQLILEHLPRTRNGAQPYFYMTTSDWDGDDIMSCATEAMIEAVDSYDDTKGASLATHIAVRARWAILEENRRLHGFVDHGRRWIQREEEWDFARTPTPSKDIWRDIDYAEIKECVRTMDEKYKDAMLQYYFQGKTQAQIAKDRNVSESYICVLLREGRKLLASELACWRPND